MARAYKDGAGASYDAADKNLFTTVPYGSVLVNPLDPKAGQQSNPSGKFFELYDFGAASGQFPWLAGLTGQQAYKAMADNSLAGVMRDCAECHVGGGMHEYAYVNMSGPAYKPEERTSLRNFDFGGLVTSLNYFIDIFNPDPLKRGEVVEQKYSETGVLEMDCLMCHMPGYDWAARKEAVRKGEFDASRAVGAKMVSGVVNGTTVFYNSTTVRSDATGKLYVDLSTGLSAKPQSENCASCHLSQYNVDWKKRGEQWLPGSDVHTGMGCMACHERGNAAGDTGVGTSGLIDKKLGLCDPAKGGNSAYDALWNALDTVNFKACSSCHEPAATPTYPTYGAPNSSYMHQEKGLTAKIAFDKAGNPASHMDLIDCTACHIKKTFDGGAMVDGSGADEEGRVALHDEPQVARDMTNGNALYWDGGKLFAANLLTSSFIRDMNGMDDANGGIDGNNDGRNAGMDTLLQTHVNDLNNAAGAHALTMFKNDGSTGSFGTDGSWVNESEVTALFARINGDSLGTATGGDKAKLAGGLKQLLNISDATNAKKLIPKMSFLMVPFKASHNIAKTTDRAWGKGGCGDCHGIDKGFYNGAYPIRGNMDGQDANGNYLFRFASNQVTTFTKVNGLADVTDSHPSVVTKKGDRSVPVPILTRFDGPYVPNASAANNQTLRNIDRSEVIYEQTFKARDTKWYGAAEPIVGAAPAAACSGPTSPFYCATPTGIPAQDAVKSKATSTKGWLLKIEVQPVGNTDPRNITFRTAQLGKDNAVSMTEVFNALPPKFRSNEDFVITEAGGALTITAAATKQIRISPQSDVAPFGLKDRLWKEDPIVRGSNTMKTRDNYVQYLNTLTSPAAFGIGINPVAAINAIPDASAELGVQVKQNDVVALTAALAQANGGSQDVGTVSYKWSTTDLDAELLNPTSRDGASIKFSTLGSKSIKLTVTDEEGKVSVASSSVTVILPPMVIEWDAAADTATFRNFPADTASVRVTWGDGLTTTRSGSSLTNPLTLKHVYSSATAKTVKFYCYNAAGAQIGYQQVVIIP